MRSVRKIPESERRKWRRKPKPQPQPDWALAYNARLKLCGLDAAKEENQLRALEFVVGLCRSHHGCGPEVAKQMVLSAIRLRKG